MPGGNSDILRDVIVLGYMVVLRIGVPLAITILAAVWLQRKLAEQDKAEERARRGEPHCWNTHETEQTQRARLAAEAHPEMPCWLAVQAHGDGLSEECFECPRYAVDTSLRKSSPVRNRVEAS
jgi:hypothetical protein